jgi:hypothetical protein
VIFVDFFIIILFVLSYPMKNILFESIVYCDFLLIILLIVGVLIDYKAFVCLLITEKHTKQSSFYHL